MQVEHQPDRQRFVVHTDGGEAELTYAMPAPDTLDLRHTFVPKAARDGGVGDALVRYALDHARRHGYRIVPTCPYVGAWLRRHPQERELLAHQQ